MLIRIASIEIRIFGKGYTLWKKEFSNYDEMLSYIKNSKWWNFVTRLPLLECDYCIDCRN